MIKYIGSKRLLVEDIYKASKTYPTATSVVDLFSGTSRVGFFFRQKGLRVFANDYNEYAYTIAQCYIQADKEKVEKNAIKLIKELNKISGKAGYFTETFCIKSRYFQPKNGKRVDAIREEIERKSLYPELKAVLLVSLMEGADRVDSTVGVQMAYIKKWATRSYNDLELRVPSLLPQSKYGKSYAYMLDASEAVRKIKADIFYIDPPYNQHSYLGNYHIWETLIKWDKPKFYGIACKREECKIRKSDYNSKRKIHEAFDDIIVNLNTKLIVVSFNNEGFITKKEMEKILSQRGKVLIYEKEYKRYVGAQIGIYNHNGEKVGKVSHLKNKEYIYVVKVS